jgi:hypothetical protein
MKYFSCLRVVFKSVEIDVSAGFCRSIVVDRAKTTGKCSSTIVSDCDAVAGSATTSFYFIGTNARPVTVLSRKVVKLVFILTMANPYNVCYIQMHDCT